MSECVNISVVLYESQVAIWWLYSCVFIYEGIESRIFTPVVVLFYCLTGIYTQVNDQSASFTTALQSKLRQVNVYFEEYAQLKLFKILKGVLCFCLQGITKIFPKNHLS